MDPTTTTANTANPNAPTTRHFRAGTVDKLSLLITAELKPKEGGLALSIQGGLYRGAEMVSGGQNRDDLKRLLEEGKPAPGLSIETLARLLQVWDRWHLNDMRAECEHQRALGWTYQDHHDAKTFQGERCPTCGYSIGSKWLHEPLPADVAAFIQSLPNSTEDPTTLLPEGIIYTVTLKQAVPPPHDRASFCPKNDRSFGPCICTPKEGMDVWEVAFSRGKGAPHVFEFRTGMGHRKTTRLKGSQPVPPKGGDVLACIANDALAYLNARDLDDFAQELGLTSPTKAQEAWEGCGRAARAFKALGLDPADPWGVGEVA